MQTDLGLRCPHRLKGPFSHVDINIREQLFMVCNADSTAVTIWTCPNMDYTRTSLLLLYCKPLPSSLVMNFKKNIQPYAICL